MQQHYGPRPVLSRQASVLDTHLLARRNLWSSKAVQGRLCCRAGTLSDLHTSRGDAGDARQHLAQPVTTAPSIPATLPQPPSPQLLQPVTSQLPGTAVPATVTVAVKEALPELMSPGDAYMALAKEGAKKGGVPAARTFVMGTYAAAYIAFGAFLSISIVNACPGLKAYNPGLAKLLFALLFPIGLTLNTLHGTELFTGNTLKMAAAVLEGKAGLAALAHNWAWSYAGNFVGSLAMVTAVLATGLLAGAHLPVDMAVAKTSLTWGAAFTRAVLANWLVCMAVYSSSAASSLPGKLAAIWPPIAGFVAMGLEHSVANMFIIPLGMALGAPVTIGAFLGANLVPVTLGNIVGGAVFVALASSSFYGRLATGKAA